jgi:hypothetical protein
MGKLTESLPKNWEDRHGPARLMAVAEGYAMMRRPGSMPFCFPVKELVGSCSFGPHGPFYPVGRAALKETAG